MKKDYAMDITPQFTYDNNGNKIGVFLSIEEWEQLEKNVPMNTVPRWEKELILKGLEEYRQNQDSLIDWETIKAEMEHEDGPI